MHKIPFEALRNNYNLNKLSGNNSGFEHDELLGWSHAVAGRGGLNFLSTHFVENWVKWQLYLRPIRLNFYAVSSIFQRLFSVFPSYVHQTPIGENSCSEIFFVLRCKFQSKCVAGNHQIQCVCFFTWKKLITTLLPSLSFLLRQFEI